MAFVGDWNSTGDRPCWAFYTSGKAAAEVAATLLDLKAARLLPQGEVDDPEDLALLEARDLLFARLLQYRAFKLVSGWIAETLADQGRRFARPGGLEGAFAKLLPEVRIDITADGLAWLAGGALTPKPAEEVSLAHLHQAQVSVREQAELMIERLRRGTSPTISDPVTTSPRSAARRRASSSTRCTGVT